MVGFRQVVFSTLPAGWQSRLRTIRQGFRDLKNDFLDYFGFSVWLFFQAALHRKKIILVRRMDALGDVVCTLPLCAEIKRLHPEKLIVYLTTRYCEDIVLLSRTADYVFNARSRFFAVPSVTFGLLHKIYNPQTTEEYSNAGSRLHLIDEFAKSCGIVLSDRQPRLYPPPGLLQKTRAAHGLDQKSELIIGINCGPTWQVREWDLQKWQDLIDRIHADYNAILVQFGIHVSGKKNQYDQLRNVRPLASRLAIEELVALVASCDLVVSIDSGPVHIAGAVGTPVIGLFGAVDPRLRLPPESPAMAVFSNVPCLFCQHRTPPGHWKSGCPHDIRCMDELAVKTVFEAVQTMLKKTRSAAYPVPGASIKDS